MVINAVTVCRSVHATARIPATEDVHGHGKEVEEQGGEQDECRDGEQEVGVEVDDGRNEKDRGEGTGQVVRYDGWGEEDCASRRAETDGQAGCEEDGGKKGGACNEGDGRIEGATVAVCGQQGVDIRKGCDLEVRDSIDRQAVVLVY